MLDGPHIYDKPEYHLDIENVKREQTYTHPGMYLGWIIDRGFYSESFGNEMAREIEAFKHRRLTSPKLYAKCGGRLLADMLNEEGNAFTRAYYFQYYIDFEEAVAGNGRGFYDVPDSWANYEKIRQTLDRQYLKWQRGELVPPPLPEKDLAGMAPESRGGRKWWNLW